MVKYLSSFLLLFSITLNSQTELKFNLASAPFLVPNIGIEVQISERFGYQLDTSASFYNNIEGSPFHMTQIFNELRFYPKNKNNKRSSLISLKSTKQRLLHLSSHQLYPFTGPFVL